MATTVITKSSIILVNSSIIETGTNPTTGTVLYTVPVNSFAILNITAAGSGYLSGNSGATTLCPTNSSTYGIYVGPGNQVVSRGSITNYGIEGVLFTNS